MNVNSTVKSIFIKIAKRMGLEVIDKTDTDISFSESGLNPTAIGAGVVSNIAVDDSEIIIEGNNARAEAIRELKEYYVDELQNAVAEVSLGTGDAIVRPYTDGKYIGLNIIGNDNFVITASIGTHLKGVIMKLDEYEKENKVYRLFESQTLKDELSPAIVHIRRFAYRDDKETNIALTSWKGMETEENIIADQLLLGRYKCPTINRDNYNSANGVPITFGCEDIVKNIRTKYKQYNEEFDRKLAKTFAKRSMFKKETDKVTGKEELTIRGHQFVLAKGGMEDKVSDMIYDYSPAIREPEFQAANNFNLSVLELCCGFSRGVFTKPETAFATAAEMKNSLKKTFAFVKRFRKRLELGDRMLFNAINIIMNINATTPLGDWDLRYDWSYDYIEETKERFNQLMQGHSAGVVKDETICAWINNLSEDKAKKYMAELKAAAKAARKSENTEDNIDDDGAGDFNV